LLELLFENNWKLLREAPCLFKDGEKPNDLLDLIITDGFQFWANSALS